MFAFNLVLFDRGSLDRRGNIEPCSNLLPLLPFPFFPLDLHYLFTFLFLLLLLPSPFSVSAKLNLALVNQPTKEGSPNQARQSQRDLELEEH